MYDAIYNTTQKYYSVGESDVIRFGEIYFYAYLVVGIPTIILAYWKLMLSLNVLLWICLVGSGLKYFAGNDFAMSLIGQAILGAGQGILYCTPPT